MYNITDSDIIARFYDENESLKAVSLIIDTDKNRLVLCFIDDATSIIDEVVVYENTCDTMSLEEFYGEIYCSIIQEIGSDVSVH